MADEKIPITLSKFDIGRTADNLERHLDNCRRMIVLKDELLEVLKDAGTDDICLTHLRREINSANLLVKDYEDLIAFKRGKESESSNDRGVDRGDPTL